MLEGIGQVLPLALGVAISPLPLMATVLLLMARDGGRVIMGFVAGWVGGIAVAVAAFTALASFLPAGTDSGQSLLGGLLKLALGVGLLLLAWRQWASRPGVGEEPKLPAWMAAIDTMTATKAAGLAFLLAGVNPKNLILAAAAGLVIGQGSAPVVTAIVFVVLASSSVLALVIARWLSGERAASGLQALRTWLVQNSATVMAVLLLVLGTVTIGKALAAW